MVMIIGITATNAVYCLIMIMSIVMMIMIITTNNDYRDNSNDDNNKCFCFTLRNIQS